MSQGNVFQNVGPETRKLHGPKITVLCPQHIIRCAIENGIAVVNATGDERVDKGLLIFNMQRMSNGTYS